MDKNIITTFVAKNTNIFPAIVALLAIMVSSCSEHIDDLEYHDVAVGDVLLPDNTFVPSYQTDSISNAIGVVMYTSNDTVWVVATK